MSEKNDVANVSTGAPKIGGYVFRSTTAKALPTDATTALEADFKTLGFISEDGVTNSNSPESSDTKDWGGTTVLSVQTSRNDTWKFTLLESGNSETLKTVYGGLNVTVGVDTISIAANNADLEYAAFVFEMVMKGNIKKRIVLPCAKVTAVEDITYKKSDAIAYGVTLTCAPDENGNTHYEYISKK